MSTAPNDQPTSVIALPQAASTAGYVGQATAIEQTRAAAEVQAAVVMAQRMPRSVPVAIARMQETCSVMELAEQAFFRYSRGTGGQITGASVHLARELARCWGNVQYGITELERDTTNRQSVMLAFAWDLETNTRATSTFIVPWVRDRSGKTEASALTSVRDQYENNANMGARRVREQIFAVLPRWFAEQAQAKCRHTIEHGSTEPLPKRISTIISRFDELGVHVDQLAAKLGRDQGHWGTGDIATLTVVGKSIAAGESTVEDEFPAADRKVTMAELAGHRTAPVSAATAALEDGLLPKPTVEVKDGHTSKATTKTKATPAPAADDEAQGMLPDDPDLGAQ